MAVLDYCKGVFTSPVTLSGLGQASDGQSVDAAGERWLLADNSVNGGIWITSAGAWERAPDLNDPADFVWGTTVYIQGGNRYYGSEWYYNGIENPTIDATTLYFNLRQLGYPEDPAAGIERTFIEGLGLSYVNQTTVALSAGQAYVPGLEKMLVMDTDQTLTRLAGSDLHYYGYLEEYPAGSGLGRLRLVTTAPGEPYFGSARTQSDDETARYLGMIRNITANGGDVLMFGSRVLGGNIVRVVYLAAHNSLALQVVNAFTGSTAMQTVPVGPDAAAAEDCLIPASARGAELFVVTTGSGAKMVGAKIDNVTYAPARLAGAVSDYREVQLGTATEVSYQLENAADSISLYVAGYYDQR